MANDADFQRVAASKYVELASFLILEPAEAAKLLNIPIGDYEAWTKETPDTVGAEEMEKISCLLGIYEALKTLYSGKTGRMARWFRQGNPESPFDGDNPHQYLVGGSIQKFYRVRRYLDSWTV